MPNFALLDATLAYIEKNPDEWDQSNWRCDTGMCFAGWAAALAGGQYLLDVEQVEIFNRSMPWELPPDWPRHRGQFASPELLVEDEERGWITEPARERAIEVLRISHTQANALFAAGNNLQTLRRMVAALHEDPEGEIWDLADDDEEIYDEGDDD